MIAFGLVFVTATVVFSLVIQGLYKHQPLFAKATAVDEILGGVLGVVQAMVLLGCAIIILDSFFRLPIRAVGRASSSSSAPSGRRSTARASSTSTATCSSRRLLAPRPVHPGRPPRPARLSRTA